MHKDRTERLKAFLTQAIAEVRPDRNNGHAIVTEADLKALLALVIVAETEMPRVGNVPEWHNHENERTGKPNLLGDVACTYAGWIEEGEEPACEHDGACQLAEMARHMRVTINALDRLVFVGNR
jgi:hypothetical protein